MQVIIGYSGNYKGVSLVKKLGDQYQVEYLLDGFTETARELMVDKDHNFWISQGYQGIYKLTLAEDLKSFTDYLELVIPFNLENNSCL